MAGSESGKVKSTEDDYNIKADLLYKFYFQFNNNYNINRNDLHIQDYSSSLLSTESARDLFKKFIKNIKLLSEKYSNQFNKIDNGEHIKKRCIYLKYWFYDQIIQKNIKGTEFNNLIKDCISKKNHFSSDESFSCEFFELNLENIKEIKKLYNFFIIYNIYKNNNIYPISYCQYLKEVSDIIIKNNSRCKSHSHDAYCNEYNRYVKPYVKEDIIPLREDKCEKAISSISTEDVDGKTNESESKYAIYLNLEKNETNICSSYKDSDMNNFPDTCQNLTSGVDECKDNIKKMVQNFVKLFCTLPENSKNNNIRDNYIKFLNFWFNRELKKIITNKNDRSPVYSHFNSLCSNVKDLNGLKDKINEINDDVYKKWSILYDLYDNYNKIMNSYVNNSEDLQNKCTQHSPKVVVLFKTGIDIYNQKDDDDEFNKALNEFRILYNKFKHEILKYKKIELPKLHKLTLTMDLEATENNKVVPFCKYVNDFDTSRSIGINSKYEIVMENSSAQDIYKKFYQESIDESLCIKYCGSLISDNSDNNKDATICAKIVTNLRKLPTITNVGNTHEDRCSNLTYWTYDILMNTFNTNKNAIVDKNIISKLNNAIIRVNKELKKDENCIYYIDGTFSELNEEKDLHDYFENYSTFINNISDNAKKETYCQYIDYISKLYKKYMKICCTCYSRPKYVCEEHCPKFFRCNREFFPIHLLHKLECKDNVSLQKEKENYESLIIDLDVIRKSQLVAMNIYKILTQDYFYRFIFTTFILLGIFLIFFLFYKFTPNRFILNEKRSKKKQNNYHNNGSNRKELLEHEKKTLNGNANKKRLRIAYHSA